VSTVDVAYDDRDHPDWFLDWGLSGSPHDKLQLAQWLERNGAAVLAGKVRDAVEREQHEAFGRMVDGHSDWRSTGRDPLAFPDRLPAEALADPGFEPMCGQCRARYDV
jgi:hypothetical protein